MSRTNPFPGMNPFMEQTWPDVHLVLIAYIRDALGMELPDDLLAKAEVQVDVFTMPNGSGRATRPDIAILEDTDHWKRGLPPVWTPPSGENALVATEPELLTVEEPPDRWIGVRTASGELITVIELLSPANKTTHREAYRTKRANYVASGVNVVEIDLLRGGRHTIDLDETEHRSRYAPLGEHYLVCASRGIIPDRREIYPCKLRERLPVIRIPLRFTDPDVPLDLQALVDRCYTTGRYWMLDYARPFDPPFGEEDAAWVAARTKEVGLR